ncbi:hypothetical protein EFA69_06455 [Rufibacter immobilis]|uniref:Uncharacterized protein n=1 Tax=Rufibacter immobilis TaxID=1348778 RepID=A0A3M9N1M1_9BACT|nr:hypothetical protein [Rufibacter immobilis]RNI30928.1 hypothetical protein EFA69_06455 [Rufibacter immobilis]
MTSKKDNTNKDRKDKLDFTTDDLIFGNKSPKPEQLNSYGLNATPAPQTERKRVAIPKGRPKKEKPQATYLVVPQESHYENEKNKFLPFSTSMRADLYLGLKRLEYHDKRTIRSILEEALEMYLKKQPHAKQPLPEKEAKKLKPMKTAIDYYYERQDDGQEE